MIAAILLNTNDRIIIVNLPTTGKVLWIRLKPSIIIQCVHMYDFFNTFDDVTL